MAKARIVSEQASASGDAVLTTDYASDGIVRGQGFFFEKNFTIANGGTLYVLVNYDTFKPVSKEIGKVFVMPPAFQSTAGPVKVNIYRGTKYTGGTPFVAFNANLDSPKRVSGTSFATDATGSDKGIVTLEYLVGGQSQGNQSAGGGAGGLTFVYRPNVGKSLVEIVNLAGAEITFHWAQMFYEV